MLRTVIRNIILLCNTVFIAALLVSYLTWYLDPAEYWFIAFFGLVYPYVLVANVLFALFWIYRKRWFFLLSTVAILLGWNMLGSVVQFNRDKENNDKSLHVLTYNVLGFNFSGWNRGVHTASMFRFIDSISADVICFQEYSEGSTEDHRKQLAEALHDKKYRFPKNHIQHFSQVIYSKYKIINGERIRFEHSFNGFVYADILFNQDTIRVYSCHLQSTRLNPRDVDMLDNFKIQNTEQELRGLKHIMQRLKYAYTLRSKQINELADHVATCKYPYILAGDFNDPSTSYTYNILRSLGRDAFTEAGSGVDNTYVRNIRGFRIDYVFYSNDFKTTRFDVYKNHFSDHYPVRAVLELN